MNEKLKREYEIVSNLANVFELHDNYNDSAWALLHRIAREEIRLEEVDYRREKALKYIKEIPLERIGFCHIKNIKDILEGNYE